MSAVDRDRSVQADSTAMLPTEAGAGRSTPAVASRVRLRMHYAPPQAPVLAVAGEVDAVTTPRLAELLWARLQSTMPALVLDLSEVSFLGLDGITLLAAVERYARYRGTAVHLVTRTRAVDRALQAGGLTDTLPRFHTTAAARAGQPSATPPMVPMPRRPNRLEQAN
ncbi:STAS domain-containing protein [Bounagaea algeriensis]